MACGGEDVGRGEDTELTEAIEWERFELGTHESAVGHVLRERAALLIDDSRHIAARTTCSVMAFRSRTICERDPMTAAER